MSVSNRLLNHATLRGQTLHEGIGIARIYDWWFLVSQLPMIIDFLLVL